MRPSSLARGAGFSVAAASAWVLNGCGGGGPLLHPAQTLPAGEVRGVAGFSTNVAVGALSRQLHDAYAIAASDPSVPGAPGTNPGYAQGALIAASVAPGVAPVAGARVGIGEQFEGGLMYTGRGARVDIRRSFDARPVTLSAGIGGNAAFYGQSQGEGLPSVALNELRGYGADIPLLMGWRSAAGIYYMWMGARAGWEHISIANLTSEPKAVSLFPEPIKLTADRFYGGGLVGMAVGFRNVHVALELNVAYQSVRGSYNGTETTVQGVTLSPASALWVRF